MDQRNWGGFPSNFVVPGSDVDISTLNQEGLYLSLPKIDIPDMAAAYVKELETATLKDWCKCEWIVHPDDIDIQAMHCRECKHSAKSHQDQTMRSDDRQLMPIPCKECGCESYKDRRIRRGEESPECPVHTREGFILGFFLWAYHVKR